MTRAMTMFHLHAQTLRHVHPWCRDSIKDFDLDIEQVAEIVTMDDGRKMKPFGGEVVALKVTIPNDADALLFKLKWHDHLLEV